MKYTLNIDVAGTLEEVLSYLGKFGARIEEYKAEGPAGGNPNVTVSFDSYDKAHALALSHFAGDGPDFAAEQIREELDPADFDLSKWKPVTPATFVEEIFAIMVADDETAAAPVAMGDGSRVVFLTETWPVDYSGPEQGEVTPYLMVLENDGGGKICFIRRDRTLRR